MHINYYFTILSPGGRGGEIHQAKRGEKRSLGRGAGAGGERGANCQAAGWQSMDSEGEVREVSRGQGSLCRTPMPLRGVKWGHFERLASKTHHSLGQICSSYSDASCKYQDLTPMTLCKACSPPP